MTPRQIEASYQAARKAAEVRAEKSVRGWTRLPPDKQKEIIDGYMQEDLGGAGPGLKKRAGAGATPTQGTGAPPPGTKFIEYVTLPDGRVVPKPQKQG
jgi:hypothetical protein